MANKVSILITGANGQLGMEFRAAQASFPQFNFLFVSKDELSITDPVAMKLYFEQNEINVCINCAAYTAVDMAESEKESAFSVNADGAGELARICRQFHCQLFHISTDYVFAGNATVPYKPSDETHPINVYAASKLAGEQMVQQNFTQAIIIRTSWVYSSYGKNFVKTMKKLMAEKESLSVVADQLGSPTYAADLACAMLRIIENEDFVPGIYHYCNQGVISWFDFAVAIKNITRSTCKLIPITTPEYPTPAVRPHYSALDTREFSEVFRIPIPQWKTSLEKCMLVLQNL